ncbi:HPt (histidine-containing phosphotransfer) domain-containing protein [Lachnospiraceae bacterium]|nr:HPt (histidine-containing phosphotransfer) domain-containing protein [Lachnospiraceae bacterium]
MTLQELYQNIGGDYEQAIGVLRVEKLVDKHIRKFTKNDVVEHLLTAGESMDPTELFEAAHAMKGVSSNLGLVALSNAASELTEEYRPGNERKLSDDEVKTRIQSIRDLYSLTVEKIQRYEESTYT